MAIKISPSVTNVSEANGLKNTFRIVNKYLLLILIIVLVPFILAYDLSDFPKFIENQSGVSIIKSYDD